VKRGDILFIPFHKFLDGGHSDKLFILMNDPGNNTGKLYLVMTTSQQKRKRQIDSSYQCQPKRQEFFFPANRFFPKNTWVLLNRAPDIRSTEEIKKALASSSSGCRIVDTLPEDVVYAIRNCIAKHCSDDLNREACDLLGIKYKG